MAIFGPIGRPSSRDEDAGAIYEAVGRRHVHDAAGSSGGALIAEIAALRKEVVALRATVTMLGIEISDTKKGTA